MPPMSNNDLPTRPAPPKSGAVVDKKESKLTPLERSEVALADKYSSPDVYISGERDTCWHPLAVQSGVETVAIRNSNRYICGRPAQP